MTTPQPILNVLALNSGSSSLKFGLYGVGPTSMECLLSDAIASADQRGAIAQIKDRLASSKLPPPAAVGHRVVHGGPKLRHHCLIDDAVLAQLEAATAFAPLHMPAALSVMRDARKHFPVLPQIACFDTVFHVTMPDVARILPVPKELREDGIQRYGFHGLSCESILHQLGDDLPDRTIIAHLGNGASVTAVKAGKSVDTSMGLTPSGGVIMGTRSGDLDPGVLVYLAREKHYDAAMLEDLVDRRSGLLGISGIGSDMRDLHRAAASNADARLAIDMFCYSVRKQIAAMIAVLGGVDLIVFTGGIGENDALVREAICAGLSWIGVGFDELRNRSADNPISDAASRCRLLVLPSQEDEQIARHASALFQRQTSNNRPQTPGADAMPETVREVVAVFDDTKALDEAVFALETRGLDRAAFSLLGSEEAVKQKLGHRYQQVKDVEDAPNVPRDTFFSRVSRLEADLLPAPILASIGALVFVGVGSVLPVLVAAGAGATLGGALSLMMHEHQATRVQEQLARGGLLLWVNVRGAKEEEAALEVLRAHSAHDVHAHDIAAQ